MRLNGRHRDWLLLFRIGCWLVLAFATVVSGGEPPIHWFHIDYFVVDHTLKGDQGLSMELLEIAKYDRSHTLPNLWWQRAARYCEREVDIHVKDLVRRKVPPETADKELRDRTEPCRHSYYVDHWDEINAMIKTQYNALKKRGP